jgi:hypothetical protein
MAFVSGFENDVFISYAHADNSEGWIDNFERRLANRLKNFGRDAAVTIWRDHKLGGADVFTEKIYEHLKASAILTSFRPTASIRNGVSRSGEVSSKPLPPQADPGCPITKSAPSKWSRRL